MSRFGDLLNILPNIYIVHIILHYNILNIKHAFAKCIVHKCIYIYMTLEFMIIKSIHEGLQLYAFIQHPVEGNT